MSTEMPGGPAQAIALLIAAIAVISACAREQPQTSPTAVALLSDPIALDAALERCNQRAASIDDPQCRTVRAALARRELDRRNKNVEGERRAQLEAERESQIKFELQRDARRRHDEGRIKEQQGKDSTDPYALPFVPPESPATPRPTSTAAPDSPPHVPVHALDSTSRIVASDSTSTRQ